MFELAKEKLRIALNMFLANDRYLVTNDLNERSISHKLGCYLQHVYSDYNVDCEYNRNCNDPISLTKKIYISKDKHQTIYPDIIVHKRGSNEHNHLIIECKKSNNRDCTYDREKMKHYTRSIYGNLGYEIGVNIIFTIGGNNDLFVEGLYYGGVILS